MARPATRAVHSLAVNLVRSLEYRSFTKADLAEYREAMKKLAADEKFWARLGSYGEFMSKAQEISEKITGRKRRSFRRRIRG